MDFVQLKSDLKYASHVLCRIHKDDWHVPVSVWWHFVNNPDEKVRQKSKLHSWLQHAKHIHCTIHILIFCSISLNLCDVNIINRINLSNLKVKKMF